MNFHDFYFSLEKLKYKNYVIDDSINLELIKELDSLINLFTLNNIKFKVTGLFGCIFFTKKIYRTIKDIDIIFEIKDIKRLFETISDIYLLKIQSNSLNYILTLKDIINKGNPIRAIKKDNNALNLDMIFVKNLTDRKYSYKMEYDNRIIEYSLPSKFYSVTDKYLKNQKNIDDINFYLKYFNF